MFKKNLELPFNMEFMVDQLNMAVVESVALHGQRKVLHMFQ